MPRAPRVPVPPPAPVLRSLGQGPCWPPVAPAATLRRDWRCTCSWVVVTPGPGGEAVSRMKYRHAACPVGHKVVAHG
jgi:hypothetical protein